MYGKKLVKNEGAKIRPSPIDIPRVILLTLAWEHMGPALFLGPIHQLTHDTYWMNRLVDPPSKAISAGLINSSGGLGQPTVPVLKNMSGRSTFNGVNLIISPSAGTINHGLFVWLGGLSVVGARSPILVGVYSINYIYISKPLWCNWFSTCVG